MIAAPEPKAQFEVDALAAIGHRQRLLVVRSSRDAGWRLPGVVVNPGVPVMPTLKQLVSDQLKTKVNFMSFLALIEHGDSHHQDLVRHRLSIVFDVGVTTDPVDRSDGQQLEFRWISSAEFPLFTIEPGGLCDGMVSGRFDDGDRWLPWRPDLQQT